MDPKWKVVPCQNEQRVSGRLKYYPVYNGIHRAIMLELPENPDMSELTKEINTVARTVGYPDAVRIREELSGSHPYLILKSMDIYRRERVERVLRGKGRLINEDPLQVSFVNLHDGITEVCTFKEGSWGSVRPPSPLDVTLVNAYNDIPSAVHRMKTVLDPYHDVFACSLTSFDILTIPRHIVMRYEKNSWTLIHLENKFEPTPLKVCAFTSAAIGIEECNIEQYLISIVNAWTDTTITDRLNAIRAFPDDIIKADEQSLHVIIPKFSLSFSITPQCKYFLTITRNGRALPYYSEKLVPWFWLSLPEDGITKYLDSLTSIWNGGIPQIKNLGEVLRLGMSIPTNEHIIIGISGWARSGKDTAAEHLSNFFSFARRAIADRPKDEAAAAYGIERSYFHNEYKDSPVLTYPFIRGNSIEGDQFYSSYPNLFKSSTKNLGCGVSLTEKYWTPRAIVSLLANSKRAIDPAFWIRRVLNPPAERIVISDVRFPVEAEYIRQRGGFIIRINRFDTPPVDAPNEHLLDHYDFDAVIDNRDDKAHFEQGIERMLSLLKLPFEDL